MASLVLVAAAAGQSTAFTYQGSLKNGAAAASGLHDLRFRLFDAAVGGTQIGTTQCVDDVQVSGGLFVTAIDFGQQFGTLAQRFLEISVRADTGLACANASGFVVLGPRQPITPTPLADHARAAFSLDAPDGSPADAVFVDNDGRVGVGTTAPAVRLHVVGDFHLSGGNVGIGIPTPQAPLHVSRSAPSMVLQDTASPVNQAGYLGFWNSAGAETGWLGFGTPGSADLGIVNARASGDIYLLPGSNANVGIGTSAPVAKLDVRGDIRLGPSGQFFAPASEENLRLIRGDVRGDGVILRGAGFTCQRFFDGVYDITFLLPFSAPPTVTVTTHASLGPERLGMHAPFFLTPSTARVITRIVGGSSTDTDFSICIIGPR